MEVYEVELINQTLNVNVRNIPEKLTFSVKCVRYSLINTMSSCSHPIFIYQGSATPVGRGETKEGSASDRDLDRITRGSLKSILFPDSPAREIDHNMPGNH